MRGEGERDEKKFESRPALEKLFIGVSARFDIESFGSRMIDTNPAGQITWIPGVFARRSVKFECISHFARVLFERSCL